MLGCEVSISSKAVSILSRSVSFSDRAESISDRAVSISVRSRFPAGRKMIKVALSAALEPTAIRDLVPSGQTLLYEI